MMYRRKQPIKKPSLQANEDSFFILLSISSYGLRRIWIFRTQYSYMLSLLWFLQRTLLFLL